MERFLLRIKQNGKVIAFNMNAIASTEYEDNGTSKRLKIQTLDGKEVVLKDEAARKAFEFIDQDCYNLDSIS